LSEITLKVGKKGEIFTTKALRKRANIREGGKVTAKISKNKVIIEPVLSIEELLTRPPLGTLTPREAEKLSEQMQKEEGIYG